MRKWLVALAIGLALLTLAAYSASGGTSSVKAGGTFRIGTSSRIDSLNPYVAFNQDAYSAFEYIYPFLIQYDKQNKKFTPDFATSWTISNGGKNWTFHTRKGAKWSDGKPLTARDAAWTNAQALWALGGAPPLAGDYLLALDRMVGLASRGLLIPADSWLLELRRSLDLREPPF